MVNSVEDVDDAAGYILFLVALNYGVFFFSGFSFGSWVLKCQSFYF